MDWGLSNAEQAIQETVREFVDAEVRPEAAARDAAGTFPVHLVRRAGELGLTGIPFPEHYGGGEAGWMPFVLAVEEISRADVSLAVTLFVSINVANLVYTLGSQEIKEHWLPPLVRGTHVGAFALTEPDAGSDNQSMRTTARIEDGQWVVNGQKAFITNSGTDITLFTIVFCVTGTRADGRKEFSSILVPTDTPGFTVLPAYRKLGLRSSATRPLVFEDCRVPEHHLLGERGAGLRYALGALQFGRVLVAASALGLAQGCLDECLRYAHERIAFGRPIGAFQAVQHQLAQMATEITAARLMVYHATRLFEAGRLTPLVASQTKLFVTEMAQRIAVAACDLFGGAGFMEETPVARFYRDVKAMTIVDGTTNIQRYLVARALGLPKLA